MRKISFPMNDEESRSNNQRALLSICSYPLRRWLKLAAKHIRSPKTRFCPLASSFFSYSVITRLPVAAPRLVIKVPPTPLLSILRKYDLRNSIRQRQLSVHPRRASAQTNGERGWYNSDEVVKNLWACVPYGSLKVIRPERIHGRQFLIKNDRIASEVDIDVRKILLALRKWFLILNETKTNVYIYICNRRRTIKTIKILIN